MSDVDSSKNVFACRQGTQGLVGACTMAYNTHQHLILRPDDVWIAILTQLSFYVNKHAEELRGLFVSHQGKKELTVVMGKHSSGDFERFISLMRSLIEEEIKDPSFLEWITPRFSTTTATDRTVCSVILMGTLKEYFAYGRVIACGIPSVTLLGER